MKTTVMFRGIEWLGEHTATDEGRVGLVQFDIELPARRYEGLVVEVKRSAGASDQDALEVIVPPDFPGSVEYDRLRDCVEAYVRVIGMAKRPSRPEPGPVNGGDVTIEHGLADAPARCSFETDDA